MYSRIFQCFLVIILFMVVMTDVDASLNVTNFTEVKNSILINETAIYSLVIENSAEENKLLQLESHNPSWIVKIEPSLGIFNASSKSTYRLMLHPTTWTKEGFQRVMVSIEAPHTDEQVFVQVPVHVKKQDRSSPDYLTSVEVTIVNEKRIDPREPMQIELFLQNRNKKDIYDLEINLQSDNELFEKIHRKINISPGGAWNDQFSFNFPSDQKPINDTITVLLKHHGREIGTEIKSAYSIQAYQNLSFSNDSSSSFLKSGIYYEIENNGNVVEYVSHKHDNSYLFPALAKLFTVTEPYALIEEGNYVWKITLSPGEKKVISIDSNYRPIVYLLVIIIMVIFLYYYYKSPITIKKETTLVSNKEDKEQVVKVLIHIANRSSLPIKDVVLQDTLTKIVELMDEKKLGMVKPTKIIEKQNNTLLKWEIYSLEPFEERIISYAIKFKVVVLGDVVLKGADIKFT